MDATNLEPGAFFTTDGTDIWKLQTYCCSPTCELKNLETGCTESFGMNGIMAKRFTRIEMPDIKQR